MARKKVVTTEEIETPHPEESGAEVRLDGIESEADPLQELINEAGEDGTIYTVRKIGGKAGETTGYCAKYIASELSLDVIRESFGAGKYQIIGRDSGGQYVGAKTVTIIEAARPVAAPVPTGVPTLTEIAALLQSQNKPAGTDPLVATLLQSMTQMMTALASRPVPEAPKGPSVMEILSMIKEMRPEKSDGGVEMLLRGLELGKELGGSGGGGDDMIGLAKSAMEMLPGLAAAQTAAAPRVSNPRPIPVIAPPVPVAPPVATVQASQTPEGEPMLMKLNWLRAQTRALLNQAARDKNPELYAEVMLDNLPGYFTAEEMLAELKAPNAIDRLASLVPEVANYRPWFENFRSAVVTFLEGDDENEDEGPADVLGVDP